MPELLETYFTRKFEVAKLVCWCICIGVNNGSLIIKCDEDECKIELF